MCSLRLLSASSNCLIAIEQPEENAQQVGNAARGPVETHDGEAGSYRSGGYRREEMDVA